MTRHILRFAAGIILNLLEIAVCLLAVALLTSLLWLILPVPAAFVIALLAVSLGFGYLHARRIERARMRGELR